MTTMDKVNQIRADIANLPKEYRALVQAEQTWKTKHPVLYAGVLIAVGFALCLIAVTVFSPK